MGRRKGRCKGSLQTGMPPTRHAAGRARKEQIFNIAVVRWSGQAPITRLSVVVLMVCSSTVVGARWRPQARDYYRVAFKGAWGPACRMRLGVTRSRIVTLERHGPGDSTCSRCGVRACGNWWACGLGARSCR